MKLFSLPDGTIDRKDRAQWITMPFDLAFAASSSTVGFYTPFPPFLYGMIAIANVAPICVEAFTVFVFGAERGETFSIGQEAGEVFSFGQEAGKVNC